MNANVNQHFGLGQKVCLKPAVNYEDLMGIGFSLVLAQKFKAADNIQVVRILGDINNRYVVEMNHENQFVLPGRYLMEVPSRVEDTRDYLEIVSSFTNA